MRYMLGVLVLLVGCASSEPARCDADGTHVVCGATVFTGAEVNAQLGCYSVCMASDATCVVSAIQPARRIVCVNGMPALE